MSCKRRMWLLMTSTDAGATAGEQWSAWEYKLGCGGTSHSKERITASVLCAKAARVSRLVRKAELLIFLPPLLFFFTRSCKCFFPGFVEKGWTLEELYGRPAHLKLQNLMTDVWVFFSFSFSFCGFLCFQRLSGDKTAQESKAAGFMDGTRFVTYARCRLRGVSSGSCSTWSCLQDTPGGYRLRDDLSPVDKLKWCCDSDSISWPSAPEGLLFN